MTQQKILIKLKKKYNLGIAANKIKPTHNFLIDNINHNQKPKEKDGSCTSNHTINKTADSIKFRGVRKIPVETIRSWSSMNQRSKRSSYEQKKIEAWIIFNILKTNESERKKERETIRGERGVLVFWEREKKKREGFGFHVLYI